jgi:SAM-dependent methyltransferase
MFAKAYDLLMADVDYEAIYTWLEPYLKADDVIMDAGCGSGYLLEELIKRNYRAIGIDIDSSMLSIALDRLVEKQLKAELYEHDLRDSLGVKVDVILMMFDVINYFKGASKIFRNMYHGLNKGGRLILDLYKEEVLEEYKDYQEEDESLIAYQWNIQAHHQKLIHLVTVQQETNRIIQYVKPLNYYVNLLNSLGFKVEIKEGPDQRKHYVIAYKL